MGNRKKLSGCEMDYRTDGNFHLDFIELIAKRMKPDIYLELGLGPDAECMNRIFGYCKRAIGVDVKSTRKHNPAWELFHLSTDEFFHDSAPLWLEKESVDLCLVDADHSAKAVEQDFFSVFPYIKQDGIVLLHDTYPENEAMTAPGYSGDCFLTAAMLPVGAGHYGYEIVTLPVPPGLTIIRKRKKHLLWSN